VCSEENIHDSAEAEPQRKDRRQHDARQRVDHLHIGIEHGRHARLAREPEADRDAGDRADREGEDRFRQRNQQVFPDHAAGEPGDNLAADVHRIGEEERRQQDAAEHRHGGEELPQCDADDGDGHLADEKHQARHE
jgi:hypothetical protein